MMRIATLMIALSLLAPLGARADNGDSDAPVKKHSHHHHKKSLADQFSGQGYGMAGCGLGSIVFGPKPGVVQIAAATTNDYVGQTFSITSGISNCDIPEMGQQAAAFIEINREVLAKEAARGQGETVAGLAYILKCSNPATFGQSLQQNYERIFSANESSYDATRAILSTMKTDQALKASCETLS